MLVQCSLQYTKELTHRSGHASFDVKHQLVLIDNIRNGFDMWDVGTDIHLRTFPTGRLRRFLPKCVSFAERAKTVIGGSDHGVVYVFDRKTGAPLDVLRHAQQGLVQAIAVR